MTLASDADASPLVPRLIDIIRGENQFLLVSYIPIGNLYRMLGKRESGTPKNPSEWDHINPLSLLFYQGVAS